MIIKLAGRKQYLKLDLLFDIIKYQVKSVWTVKEGTQPMILLAVLLLITSSVENKSPPFLKLDSWKDIVRFDK